MTRDCARMLAQFRRLEDSVRRKMMPAFGDIDSKLQACSDELDGLSFERDEPSFHEGEYKAELYALFEDELRSTQSDMAAFVVAALYNHWERSLKWMIARKHRPDRVHGLGAANFDRLKTLLQFDGLPAECKSAFDDIELGRLIANVIKHGEGPSAEALRIRAPDLSQRPWGDEAFDLPSTHGLNLIWVSKVQIDVVADAIRRFWETLPVDRLPASLPITLASMLNGASD